MIQLSSRLRHARQVITMDIRCMGQTPELAAPRPGTAVKHQLDELPLSFAYQSFATPQVQFKIVLVCRILVRLLIVIVFRLVFGLNLLDHPVKVALEQPILHDTVFLKLAFCMRFCHFCGNLSSIL